MGFLNRLKNNQNSATENPAQNAWNALGIPETNVAELDKMKANEDRQRNKLIGAILPGNGNPDMEKITTAPNLGPKDKNIALAKISRGLITYDDFSKVIDSIKSPLDNPDGSYNAVGAQRVYENMSEDKHQLKMLCFANGIDVNDYQNTQAVDLERFSRLYENPMQFEKTMTPFFQTLMQYNSPQKVAQYRVALDKMERNLFGKQYDYYLRAQELVYEAGKICGAPERNPLIPPDIAEHPSNGMSESVEYDVNNEHLIKGGSDYQMSRAQVRQGLRANMGEYLAVDFNCEDSKFIDLDHGLFGVFDGAGGEMGGKRASLISAETMTHLLQTNGEPKTPDDLADWLDEASRRVLNDPNAGYSTATLAKVVLRPDGKKAVIYAQVGDSRLYVVHPNGYAAKLTKDEGEGHTITNALGVDKVGNVCVQAGFYELNRGDKLVLCSDGVTGDTEADQMSDAELGAIVKGAGDTAYAAQALVNSARKTDDRTAIVVEV